MKRLDPETWCQSLALGRLNVDTQSAGFRVINEGWGFIDRTVDAHVFYVVIKGALEARIYDQKKQYTLGPGSFFLMAPGVRHDLKMQNPSQPPTVYHIRLLAEYQGQPCALGRDVLYLKNAVHLRPLVDNLFDELKSQTRFKAEKVRSHLVLLFTRMFEELESPTSGGGLTPGQREKVMAFATQHIAARPMPNELAAQVGLSPEYFARQFKKTFGVVPRTWLIQERIRIAAISLVETSLSISELAVKLGYEDLFLFSRQFKQLMGCSPRAYRKKCGAGA